MKRSKRTPEQLKILCKKIVKYYFNTPGDNSYNSIAVKFNCNKAQVRNAISNELDNRFKKRQQECINE